MLNDRMIEMFHRTLEWAALVIELLAVTVTVSAVVIVAVQLGIVRYLFQRGDEGSSESYELQSGNNLFVKLEISVPADVIRTVTLDPTVVMAGPDLVQHKSAALERISRVEGRNDP